MSALGLNVCVTSILDFSVIFVKFDRVERIQYQHSSLVFVLRTFIL